MRVAAPPHNVRPRLREAGRTANSALRRFALRACSAAALLDAVRLLAPCHHSPMALVRNATADVLVKYTGFSRDGRTDRHGLDRAAEGPTRCGASGQNNRRQARSGARRLVRHPERRRMNEHERLGLPGLLRRLRRRPAGHFRDCGAVAASPADTAGMVSIRQRAARRRFGRHLLMSLLGMVVPAGRQVLFPVLLRGLRFMRMVALHRAEQHRRCRDSLKGNCGHDQPCEKNAPERHAVQILQKPGSVWGATNKSHEA